MLSENDARLLPEIQEVNEDENLTGAGEGLPGGDFAESIFGVYADLFFRAMKKNLSHVCDYWTPRVVSVPGSGQLLISGNPHRRRIIFSYTSQLYLASAPVGSTSVGSNAFAPAPLTFKPSDSTPYYQFEVETTGDIWLINPNVGAITVSVMEEFYRQDSE